PPPPRRGPALRPATGPAACDFARPSAPRPAPDWSPPRTTTTARWSGCPGGGRAGTSPARPPLPSPDRPAAASDTARAPRDTYGTAGRRRAPSPALPVLHDAAQLVAGQLARLRHHFDGHPASHHHHAISDREQRAQFGNLL